MYLSKGLALPMGPCSPGYYCVGGATEATPTDGETGNICPPGTYCSKPCFTVFNLVNGMYYIVYRDGQCLAACLIIILIT